MFNKNIPKLAVMTPENIYLELETSLLYKRFCAFIIDIFYIFVIFFLSLLGIFLLLFLIKPYLNIPAEIILAFLNFWHFILINGYFIFFELRTGSTPGKKIYKYRVIQEDGTALTASSIYIRNLMREVEIWLPFRYILLLLATQKMDSNFYWWIFLFMLIPIFEKKHRRLGDLLAGTIVVTMPRLVLQEDVSILAEKKVQKSKIAFQQNSLQSKITHISEANISKEINTVNIFSFSPEMLDIYGQDELKIIEDILRGQQSLTQKEKDSLLHLAVKKITKKIGYFSPISPEQESIFLNEFYRAQRIVLEKKLVRGQSLESQKQKQEKK